MTRPSCRTPTIKRARLTKDSSSLVKENKKIKTESAISKLSFVGWINPPKDWELWVKKLCPAHQSTWKSAGIYEAVMSSTYAIKIHDDLILELASRWSSETSTFIFPWGEATLTLQDMLVLGGFSPLGISALSSLENDVESLKIKQQLELAEKEIRTSAKSKIARQTKWMEKFIGSGSDLENAAFLSQWLSRFVFPKGTCFGNIINRRVFPIAARLSRGFEVALAPAVLAMLYKELTSLTKWLHSTESTQLVAQLGKKERPTDLCAAFHLVQIWAWERFPLLKPVPDRVYSGEKYPRLARWSNVKIPRDRDLRSAIDSSKKAFLWCPYNVFPKLEGRDLESYARCTEMSELVGIDSCIERYQPHRVIRQFRLDQDIPTDNVAKISASLIQPTVATCFEKWRKQKRCSTSSQVKVENTVDCGPPPGFPDVAVEVKDTCFVHKTEEPERANKQQTEEQISLDGSDEDDGKNNSGQLVQPHHSSLGFPSSDNESNEAMDTVNGSVHEQGEDEGKVVDAKHDEIEGMEGRSTGSDTESYTNERSKDLDLDLEARISRLENIVYAHIKALEAAR